MKSSVRAQPQAKEGISELLEDEAEGLLKYPPILVDANAQSAPADTIHESQSSKRQLKSFDDTQPGEVDPGDLFYANP